MAKDENLFAFHSTRLGALTAGTWSPYFDGSDMSLTNNSEDLWGLWWDARTHDSDPTTAGAFDVNGLTGSGADIFLFQPTTLGTQTTGTFHPFWRGAAYGFGGEKIDDLEIITRLPLPNEVALLKANRLRQKLVTISATMCSMMVAKRKLRNRPIRFFCRFCSAN